MYHPNKMIRQLIFFIFCVLFSGISVQAEPPLRVFIRAGVKTHGPGEHDHPRFLKEWTQLLDKRGAKADGSMDFPSSAQLNNTDVLVFYAANAGDIEPEQRHDLEAFLKRGGGLVVIHDAVCGHDPEWFKGVIGGAWEHGHSKWFEGEVGIHYTQEEHPITRGASNFFFDDEIYYNLHMMPGARVLAQSFHSTIVTAPQMWVYEKDAYRAFVSIPGHKHASFSLPHYRAILLRGIAWAGRREVDSLVNPQELDSLLPPERAQAIKANPAPAGKETAKPTKLARTFSGGSGPRVLIVGGGQSHDFDRWFNREDTATLGSGKMSVHYTDRPIDIAPALKQVDVLMLTNNKPIPGAQTRKAVFDFARRGGGLVLVHPALWYNWRDWPEYNSKLVGGGSRGHDKYGNFEVEVIKPDHPVMAGVPAKFAIRDELYRHSKDPRGTPADILAQATSPLSGKTYPNVWITKHPKARIVCITLGHDGASHTLSAFKTLLKNAARWASQK